MSEEAEVRRGVKAFRGGLRLTKRFNVTRDDDPTVPGERQTVLNKAARIILRETRRATSEVPLVEKKVGTKKKLTATARADERVHKELARQFFEELGAKDPHFLEEDFQQEMLLKPRDHRTIGMPQKETSESVAVEWSPPRGQSPSLTTMNVVH